MSNKNNGYDSNSFNYAQITAGQADSFNHAANVAGGWRNFSNLTLGTKITSLLTGDTNYKANQTILQDNEVADKSKFVVDAKKAGMSQKQAESELNDIDKRTSTDAFTKQFPGMNQGGKYQSDYDNHNSLLNELSPQAKKEQQVRADALTLYNQERDNKKDLYKGNALTHDPRAAKKGAEIDTKVNRLFGMNKNGQSVGTTLNKYNRDNHKIDQRMQAKTADHQTNHTLEEHQLSLY